MKEEKKRKTQNPPKREGQGVSVREKRESDEKGFRLHTIGWEAVTPVS